MLRSGAGASGVRGCSEGDPQAGGRLNAMLDTRPGRLLVLPQVHLGQVRRVGTIVQVLSERIGGLPWRDASGSLEMEYESVLRRLRSGTSRLSKTLRFQRSTRRWLHETRIGSREATAATVRAPAPRLPDGSY